MYKVTFTFDDAGGGGRRLFMGVAIGLGAIACAAPPAEEAATEEELAVEMAAPATPDPGSASIERGRLLVITHACGECHNGGANPDSPEWLIGVLTPLHEFPIALDPRDPRVFLTRPRNITPHEETGIGRFTERQIFNALRFGLQPGETPDVEITSNVPGQGNFPASPRYLAPPMPWPSFRHLPDQSLWDIAAYLKRGVRPVEHLVQESEAPSDFWAGYYEANARVGTYPLPGFPAAGEVGQ